MTRLACLFALLLPAAIPAADLPKPTVVAKDMPDITGVCVTPDGRTFVTQSVIGQGGVAEVKDGKATQVADIGLPQGVIAFQQWLYVTDLKSIHRVDIATGKSEVWAAAADFGDGVKMLLGMAVDERGVLYVAAKKGDDRAVYSVGLKPGGRGKPPTRGEIKAVPGGAEAVTAGVVSDGMSHLILPRIRSAKDGLGVDLMRLSVADGRAESVAELPPTRFDDAGTNYNVVGLCADPHGRLFVLTDKAVWGVPRLGAKAVKVADLSGAVRGIAFHPITRQLLIGENKQKAILAIPAVIPGWEVDETPLSFETELAFADVKWTGWDDGSSSGRVVPLRPIALTHANDASGRTFVATQHGVIHVVEKGSKESKVFLDIQGKCLYRDDQNEQGLLGLAFHPKYKENGEFFVFYTDKAKKLENVVCRFKVSKDDPNKADPASEQELMRISHKYWNHDGGTVAFGPDGFLYIVLGDGGSANDPDDHGQKTDTILGKILRIDINSKGENTPYGIPKDNPFVGKKEYRPEVFALGVRNPWRLSFDRKTGQGWFGEVGQNLWEEINLLEKGANYGWRRRESLHPFGADGTGPKPEFTDPIWEYHHDVGKSITGGHVYRGKELPELEGMYLYADYVSGKLWGLKYDEKAKRVTANRPIAGKNLPILSFGEDEAGEVYLMTYAANGKGIYKFKKK